MGLGKLEDQGPRSSDRHTATEKGKAPTTGARGTVYDRSSKAAGSGPTSEELAAATIKWLKTFKPVALESKVEVLFREEQWEIIWTPPYCPKFQPIELVWGVGKQRAGTLYKQKRTLKATKRHLRRGWYGGKGKATARFEPCNVRGCWQTAEGEMNKWIANDKAHTEEKGVSGVLGALEGAERWTRTMDICLFIDDMKELDRADEDTEANERETERR